MSPASAARADIPLRPALLHSGGGQVEAEYLGDRWNAGRLGVPAPRGRASARFDTIAHDWLRDPVKAWCRFRLASELPRFVPEFVMAQLESAASLARLPTVTARNMVVVLIETGLRGGDACTLEFSPIIGDSAGGPCLRFRNLKIGAEQLIPVSAKAAAAIRSQQDHDRKRWPAGTPWLFPGIAGNADGSKPYYHATLLAQLRRWQDDIDLRDEAGAATRVTAHRFRHTLGTRLKMSGVASDASFPGKRDRGAVRERGAGSLRPVADCQRERPGQMHRGIIMLQRPPLCCSQSGCIARQHDATTATPNPQQRGRDLPKVRSSR